MPSKLVTCNICCLHQLYSVFIHLLFLMVYIQKEKYLNWRGRHIWHFFLLKQDIRSQININDLSYSCSNLKGTWTLSWDSWQQLFFFFFWKHKLFQTNKIANIKFYVWGHYIYFSVSKFEKAPFQYKLLRNIHTHILSKNIHIHTCVYVY